MLRWTCICILILLVSLLAPLYSQPAPWRDPSPHTAPLVSVDKDVRLDVLDWAGSGRPGTLLAGGGNTAHVFAAFAPKLAANYHRSASTPSGFRASRSTPSEH